ncbi:hypothetical protein Syun_001747 [Stephania yunnanensis]|uniref:Uncharacterized protein n=1 Tax=Stephania yunnanensis TaxID=152371 RepID=A0AAP0LGA3_9MAGN
MVFLFGKFMPKLLVDIDFLFVCWLAVFKYSFPLRKIYANRDFFSVLASFPGVLEPFV